MSKPAPTSIRLDADELDLVQRLGRALADQLGGQQLPTLSRTQVVGVALRRLAETLLPSEKKSGKKS